MRLIDADALNGYELGLISPKAQKLFHKIINDAPTVVLKQEPCTDVISRQAVIDVLRGTNNDWLFEKLKMLPPVTPAEKQEPCADCISRQAVLEVIEKCHCEEWVKADIGAPIEALQPITPQPKIGRWILQPSNKEQGERDFIWWKCSECGQVIYSETEQDRREYHSYCGRCGTKMQEVEYE